MALNFSIVNYAKVQSHEILKGLSQMLKAKNRPESLQAEYRIASCKGAKLCGMHKEGYDYVTLI